MWIGKVPEHWKLRRMKFLLRETDARSIDGKEQLLRVSQYSGVTERKSKNGSEQADTRAASLIGYKKVARNDLVINIMLAWNGSLGVSSFVGIVSPAYCVYSFRPGIVPRYYHSLLRSPAYKGRIKIASTGVVESRLRLYTNNLGDIEALLPPPAEQAAIAKYLSHATARIDQAIAAKKKVVGLLEEEKRTIIQKAVTKGLDPNAKMKDSGVPWIGEIPEGWSCVRNLALFANRVEHGIPGLPIFQVSLHSGVTEEPLDQFGREKWLINNQSMYKLVRLNDIAYNTMRMWQGAVGVVPKDGLVSPAYVVLRPRDGVFSKYYELLFRTGFYKGQMNRFSTGIVSDRNRLYWDSFKQMPNLLIPEPEQKRIVAGINKLLSPVLLSIEKTDAEISLLREYRTRFVADVVTGKLDVRKAAEGLPEVDEVPVELVEEEGEIEDEEAEEA